MAVGKIQAFHQFMFSPEIQLDGISEATPVDFYMMCTDCVFEERLEKDGLGAVSRIENWMEREIGQEIERADAR